MAKPKPKAKTKAPAKPVAKKSAKSAKPVAKKAAPAPKQAAAPAPAKSVAAKPVAAKPVAAKPAMAKPPVAKPAPAPAAKPASAPKKPAAAASPSRAPTALRTLRSCIYQVDDLPRAKAFYAAALDRAPYFDEPYYVGFDVDGVELGLDPDVSERRPGRGGAVGYWQVDEVAATFNQLLALGGAPVEQPHDVGGGVHIAIVADPCGNLVGLVQRPK